MFAIIAVTGMAEKNAYDNINVIIVIFLRCRRP